MFVTSSTDVYNMHICLYINILFGGGIDNGRKPDILGTRQGPPTMKMPAAVLAVAVFASGFALVSAQGEETIPEWLFRLCSEKS